MTRVEWKEIWNKVKQIESVNKKVWKSGHYKWANNINWNIQRIKDLIQSEIGQME